MSLGDWNAVRGCSGWFYGLLIRDIASRTYTYSVHRPSDHASIDLVASCYRTTTTARRMGIRHLRGYQHVAQEAIRAFEQHDGEAA